MTDAVRVTEPSSGPRIATDAVGDTNFQIVKLDVGADGASTPVSGQLPVKVYATQDNGDVAAIPSTAEGHLEVAVLSPTLPFGSIHSELLHPVFQADATYGINTAIMRATTGLSYDPGPTPGSNSATVTTANNMFVCSTGTTAYSFGTLQSVERLRYRPGQGVVERFTTLWSAPAESSIVVAGIGSAEAGYFFGYNGTSFGILHSTGGVREIQTFTVTGATSTGGTVTFRLNGLDYEVTLATSATTTLTANDIASQTFPGWTVEARGATVIFLANSVGNKSGTFSITLGTAVGTAGSFAETLAGAAASDVWVPQSSWNGDPCDGTGASGFTLDKTQGNVFQIGVAYLGFGPVTFSIMQPSSDGDSARWVVVHTRNNSNNRTTPHMTQPSFPFTMAAYSAGSTTNVSVSVASLAGFIVGGKYLTGPRMSYFKETGTTSSTSAYVPIFTIRNDRVFAVRANQTVVNVLGLGGSTKSANGVTGFYLIKNAALTGASWTQFAARSCTYYDTTATAATFATNDQVVWTGSTTGDGQIDHAFKDDILLQPGETLTLAVRSVTGTALCLGQVNTREDQ